MKKKIFLISSVTVVAILIVFGAIYLLNNKMDKRFEPISAVPSEAAMIVEINFPTDFLTGISLDEGVLSEFVKTIDLNINNSLMHCVDSLAIFSVLQKDDKLGKGIWSFHPEGTNPFTQLLVFITPENIKDKQIFEDIKSKLSSLGNIREREFNGVMLAEFKSSIDLPDLHFCVKNGLFIISFSQKMLEKSVDRLNSEKALPDLNAEFNQLYTTAGKKEVANFYVNMNLFPDVFLGYLTSTDKTTFEKMKSFSEWTELDLSFDAEKISLNGFSKLSDSVSSFTSILMTQESSELNVIDVLPDNTSFYFALSINKPDAFRQELADYNTKIGEKQKLLDSFSKIKTETGIDVNETFYPLMENEACFAVTSPGNYDIYENSYMILGLKSQYSAEIELSNIIKVISKNSGVPMNQLQDVIKIDEKTSVDVYVLPFTGLPELLFGHNFSKCTGQYVCCINSFMIFANSKNSLFRIVYDIVLNKTLKTSIDYNLFLDNFSESSNLFIYFSMYNGYEIFESLFTDEIKLSITENMEVIYGFGNFGYQVNKSNDMLYNNLVVKKQAYAIEKPQTVWESRLDTTVSIKPVIVTNHDNNSREIIVQDCNNNLYLLSHSGREIWRVKIDEKIESNIYQIDLYKNGKLQYLFSTKNKLHLIDRLGNYVDKYPVKLRSASTAPMSLFDYNNDKSYRIIIPCSNNKVYLYDAEGDIVKGWNFDNTEDDVSAEICHYNVDGEDYIVFKDKYKSYFLDRKGESRVDFLTKFTFSSKNKIYFDNTYSKPRFVTTDSNGMIRYFYKNGDQDSLKIKDFSEDHYFILKDVDCDGSADYVYLDGKRLEVFNRQKKLIFSYEFEAEPSSEPFFYRFPSNQIKIGVVCYSVSKIYLINSDGSLFDGFPLFGLTPFSIGYLSSEANKFNLIVGGQENLLYNYEVNEN